MNYVSGVVEKTSVVSTAEKKYNFVEKVFFFFFFFFLFFFFFVCLFVCLLLINIIIP